MNHPNIVKVRGYTPKPIPIKQSTGTVEALVLGLEYAPSGDLFKFIKNSPFQGRVARYYFRQLIQAVEFMHDSAIAHRDIKLENLLLDADFNLKIADFGYSTINLGFSVDPLGTPIYQAPETRPDLESDGLAALPYESKKVDVFNCGAVLFMLITGKSPLIDTYGFDTSRFLWSRGTSDAYWENYPRTTAATRNCRNLIEWMMRE